MADDALDDLFARDAKLTQIVSQARQDDKRSSGPSSRWPSSNQNNQNRNHRFPAKRENDSTATDDGDFWKRSRRRKKMYAGDNANPLNAGIKSDPHSSSSAFQKPPPFREAGGPKEDKPRVDFSGTKHDVQIKKWDYSYRTPESCVLRFEQLDVIIKEEELNFSEASYISDSIWKGGKERYASYKKTKVDMVTVNCDDPLGLNDPRNVCEITDIIPQDPQTHPHKFQDSALKIEQDDNFEDQIQSKSYSQGSSMSSLDIESSEDGRRKRMRLEMEADQRRRDEGRRKREEAMEEDRKEKIRRENREHKRTMIDKKVIDESRRLPSKLKEFDLVGSILMPQTKARLNKTRLEDETNESQVSSSTSREEKASDLPPVSYYCEICDLTMSSMLDNVRHCNSYDHLLQKKAKELLMKGDSDSNEKKDEKESPAKLNDSSDSVRLCGPATPPGDGPPSPCPSNAPSVDSDCSDQPLTSTPVKHHGDGDKPSSTKEVKQLPVPSDGIARLMYLISFKRPISLMDINEMKSLRISNEKEAQFAKELLRVIDVEMYDFASQSASSDVTEMLLEKGLLRKS